MPRFLDRRWHKYSRSESDGFVSRAGDAMSFDAELAKLLNAGYAENDSF